MNLKEQSRIYFMAICGTGMSALAGLLKERGFIVAGSDVAAYPPVSDQLKSLNIPVHLGFDVSDLKKFKPDYVVIGNFIRKDNPQAQYVLQQKIPYGSFPSTLEALFLEKTKNVVVAGTHGKSTTTSCLAHLLSFAGKDPNFLVGSVPLNFSRSFHVGTGEHFVIEGDEYDTAFFDKESKFLHYRPWTAVFTSMEYDHADIFPDDEAIEKMFKKFIGLIPRGGNLFYCRDWDKVHELIRKEQPRCNVKSYGFHRDADHRISHFKDEEGGLSFELDGTSFQNFMAGDFNAQNFAGAILAARACGLSEDDLSRGLSDFRGLKRRQEVIGQVGPHLVVDDFAHHPTAVKRVIRGLKDKYPRHKLIVFFEPRSNTSRRRVLQDLYDEAFLGADFSGLAEIFKEESIAEGDRLDISEIVKVHRAKGADIDGPLTVDKIIDIAKNFAKKSPCVFAVLSNGDFGGLHQKLISALKLK